MYCRWMAFERSFDRLLVSISPRREYPCWCALVDRLVVPLPMTIGWPVRSHSQGPRRTAVLRPRAPTEARTVGSHQAGTLPGPPSSLCRHCFEPGGPRGARVDRTTWARTLESERRRGMVVKVARVRKQACVDAIDRADWADENLPSQAFVRSVTIPIGGRPSRVESVGLDR